MSRWQPDARERLEQAALELFAQQGFAATTVPEITARAGLTTRTFFRHFADKREVIFSGEAMVPAFATRLMAEAPAGLAPMELVLAGLRTVAETRFEGRREDLRARRDIVRTDDSLRERDLRKRAGLSEAVREGFVLRGVAPTTAALLADTCVTLLYVSLEEWLDQEGDRPLFEIITATLAALRATLTPG